MLEIFPDESEVEVPQEIFDELCKRVLNAYRPVFADLLNKEIKRYDKVRVEWRIRKHIPDPESFELGPNITEFEPVSKIDPF
jgi:hypothetical protein